LLRASRERAAFRPRPVFLDEVDAVYREIEAVAARVLRWMKSPRFHHRGDDVLETAVDADAVSTNHVVARRGSARPQRTRARILGAARLGGAEYSRR
jgi:hypothetical protein